MTRRCGVVLGLVLLVAASCDRGSGKPPGLEGAGPLVAEFARTAKSISNIGSAVATWSGEGELPGSALADVTAVGETARAVLNASEPDGDAGAAALSAAVTDVANEVVRHFVTSAGGRQEGSDRMAIDPPNPVVFDADAKDPPTAGSGRDRNEDGKAEARDQLEDILQAEIVHFVYVALLAHSDTRAALAPRLSSDDLPAEVPDDLNLPVATRDEWRQDLFDGQKRLVVPSPLDPVRWSSFIGWTKVVSPKLRFAAESLANRAFRLLSG